MLKSKKSIKSNIRKRHIKKRKKIRPAPAITIQKPVLYIDRNASCYRVLYKDVEGHAQFYDIGREVFGKPTDVAKMLLSAHADLPLNPADQKTCINDCLSAMDRTKPTLKVTSRLGWHQRVGQAPSFVYFDKTFGPERDTLQFDDAAERNRALGMRLGSLEAWQDLVKEACQNSDHLIFALGIGAAGPLFGMMDDAEPAIYHFQGAVQPPGDQRNYKSSSGKTFSARLLASTYGRCTRLDLFGFKTTERALEETCAGCNNLFMVLDEEGAAGDSTGKNQMNRKDIPYFVVGGQGKRRARVAASSQALRNLTWSLPVVTTSEDELDPSGKTARKDGAKVRMVAIPFPPTFQGGIFHKVVSPDERNRLAASVEKAITNNYGIVMPKYLAKLVSDAPTLRTEIPAMAESFMKNVGVKDADNWERRFALKFAMVSVGAQLLARYGYGPWTEERAVTAVTNLYKASRGMTVSVPQATDALLERLRNLVAAKKRFPRVPKGKAVTATQKSEMWGVVREIGDKKNVTAVRPTRFKKLVQPSAVSDQVLAELGSRGALVKDPDGKTLTRQVKITGLTDKRARYVCIKGLVANKSKVKPKKKSKFKSRAK